MKKKISAEYKRKEKKRKREILVDKRKTIGENGKREGFLVIKKVARRCQKGNSSSKRKGVVRSSRKYDTRAPKKKKISTIIKREKKMKSIGTKSSYKKKKKKRKKKENKWQREIKQNRKEQILKYPRSRGYCFDLLIEYVEYILQYYEIIVKNPRMTRLS